MNEFKKRLAQQGTQTNTDTAAAPRSINGIPNSVLNDVFAGKRKATNEMMGHRADLAPSVLGRMSQAFGMDFSGVQVYRSDAMAGTGMGGMAQGNKVVLGSDVDLNTREGQALLGHELSHIRAQSMGIGTGNGLLSDAALEHQADNEGLLAAGGQNIYGESMGMTTGLGMAGFEGLQPLGGGMSATAAAPMQAGLFGDKDDDNEYEHNFPEKVGLFKRAVRGIHHEKQQGGHNAETETGNKGYIVSEPKTQSGYVASDTTDAEDIGYGLGAYIGSGLMYLPMKIAKGIMNLHKNIGYGRTIANRGDADYLSAQDNDDDNDEELDVLFDQDPDLARYKQLKTQRENRQLSYEDANEYYQLKEKYGQ